LRGEITFEKRVVIYLSAQKRIITQHGLASASFFAPDDRRGLPKTELFKREALEIENGKGSYRRLLPC
jgi:hypothetical protein